MNIGFIGAGNMGGAMISGIYKKYSIYICEDNAFRAEELKKKYRVKISDAAVIGQNCEVIILAVKPQDIRSVLKELKPVIDEKTLIVSIAAGLTINYLEKGLPYKARVIRTMPNMPVQIGEGMTAVCQGTYARQADMKTVKDIFRCVGETVVVDERIMDAVTAISGSGPAYLFFFVECLLKAARSIGVSGRVAKKLIYQTLEGSLHQMAVLNEEPDVLRKRVTSKGGTTEAAFKIFDKAGTEKIFKDALKAAKKRGRELAK